MPTSGANSILVHAR
jgi:hypothetical protein